MALDEFVWQGKPVLPSRAAQEEMASEDIDLYKVVEILETGFNCSPSVRARGTIERCLVRGTKVLKAVVVDVERAWLITHVGRFSLSRRIKRLRRNDHEDRL